MSVSGVDRLRPKPFDWSKYFSDALDSVKSSEEYENILIFWANCILTGDYKKLE